VAPLEPIHPILFSAINRSPRWGQQHITPLCYLYKTKILPCLTIACFISSPFFFVSCANNTETKTPEVVTEKKDSVHADVKTTLPDWALQSNIYEVNVRQYTKEGTYNAFATSLPRLKAMGVQILWFMPITPISVKDRKGKLGSYYAVQDWCRSWLAYTAPGFFY
jgi:hypothetical protein